MVSRNDASVLHRSIATLTTVMCLCVHSSSEEELEILPLETTYDHNHDHADRDDHQSYLGVVDSDDEPEEV